MQPAGPFQTTPLHPDALNVARGLTGADDALVAVLRDLQRERERAEETNRSVVRALAATLLARDGYAGDRSEDVEALAVAVGRRLGLSAGDLEDVAATAMLHDVGKIGVPDEILRKQDGLSSVEWAVLREHPVIGERILSSVTGLAQVAKAVRHEHENFDGTGYPDRIAGDAIPVAARIVFACDSWLALVSDRPYRTALEHEPAIAELRRQSGTQFDPQVVIALLAVLAAPREHAAAELARAP